MPCGWWCLTMSSKLPHLDLELWGMMKTKIDCCRHAQWIKKCYLGAHTKTGWFYRWHDFMIMLFWMRPSRWGHLVGVLWRIPSEWCLLAYRWGHTNDLIRNWNFERQCMMPSGWCTLTNVFWLIPGSSRGNHATGVIQQAPFNWYHLERHHSQDFIQKALPRRHYPGGFIQKDIIQITSSRRHHPEDMTWKAWSKRFHQKVSSIKAWSRR